MSKIEFSKEEKSLLVKKIQLYFNDELDQTIGQFDAEFLLDFFAEEVGVYFYNRGLLDAQAILESKMDSITDAIYEIEKPTEFSRWSTFLNAYLESQFDNTINITKHLKCDNGITFLHIVDVNLTKKLDNNLLPLKKWNKWLIIIIV